MNDWNAEHPTKRRAKSRGKLPRLKLPSFSVLRGVSPTNTIRSFTLLPHNIHFVVDATISYISTPFVSSSAEDGSHNATCMSLKRCPESSISADKALRYPETLSSPRFFRPEPDHNAPLELPQTPRMQPSANGR